ncbi:ABC transporter permease subunit [Cypionkella sp.]|uniref:ABC transporter permease subunit n=1 Tax=Cypionkella sp. TaxID=2811411 RepID=UPI002AB9EAB4|nr:ABC transporter permease subunit [Cypionkella sp.]MDZ4392608.1 ABC transporter permease subunit [Cypionkella sp.]
MATALHLPGTLHLTGLLVRRELGAKLTSPWFFVVATAICLTALVYGSGFQQSFETETVLVTSDPLLALNVMVISFVGLVLGLRLASGLAWEREHRTLEVLLVGPVPWSAVVLAKFLVELCVLALLLAIYWAYLLLAQPLGAGVIGLADTLPIGQMPIFVLPLLALGLLISAWARSVRSAVVGFLVLVGLLAIYEATLAVMTTLPAADMSLSSLYLRAGLESVAPVLHPVSAVGALAGLIERSVTQNPVTALQTGASLALTVATLGLCIIVARFKGTQG